MPDLPTGTVTFLFTDVQGSTKLLHEIGDAAYAQVLSEHHRLCREAWVEHGGVEVDTAGDAFFVAFARPSAALAAAATAQAALSSGPLAVRMGLHTGEILLADTGYVGMELHRAARIAAAGHGGQVLVSASTAALVDRGGLRDLGEHRFKDLAAPERVYQLGEDDFPPLKSLYQTNLPVPATSFLGRDRELSEVVELLARPELRLLTLTGPGGTGKTRLALQAAAEVSDHFPDGVFWVPLAPLRDPSLVPTSVAQVLEVNERPGASFAETIVAAMAGKRALLLLDNCEHLVDAVAELVGALVERCPRLVVAASSRERLGLRSERMFAVPPMEAADSETLFSERARAVQADFEADEHVSAICEAVDGLPLAVELAAARARSLSTAAIRERLGQRLSLLTSRDRGVDERQRTLEATIAWSYDLLEPEEQRVLRALSVFAGGCTLAAAEQVAGADLDLLESLLDKSLLRHRVDQVGQDRYWMLETIREYAAGELERQDDVEAARERHEGWVLDFMREGAPRWADTAPQDKLDRVLADDGNIRVALMQAIDRRHVDRALELVGLVGRTYLESGRFKEMDTMARGALAVGTGQARFEGMALLSSGYVDWQAGRESFEAAAERFRAAGMEREAAYATMALAVAEGELGSVDEGLELLEVVLADFERFGDDYLVSITRNNIVYLQSLRWPLEPAEARRVADRVREAVEAARRIGDQGDEVAALDNLSHVLIDADELDEAWWAAVRAAGLIRDAHVGGNSIVPVVAALARCAGQRGDFEQALLLASALRSVGSELGQTLSATRRAALEAVETSCGKALEEETAKRATAAGEAMTVESLLEYLATLE